MPIADYPAGLRTADRVSSQQSTDGIIIHKFLFANAYGARVWGRQDDTIWTVAMTKNDTVLRSMVGLPRMPHDDTVANINSILESIEEAEPGSWSVPPADGGGKVTQADLDALKASILGGVGAAGDTLAELQAQIDDDDDAVAAIVTTLGTKAAAADVTLLDKTVGNTWLTEKNLALRGAIIGLKAAQTTRFDILWGPSDSLGESAYVTAAKNRVTQIVLERLRRIYNPSGVVGGYGYYGAASNVWVTGDPLYGASGTVTNGNTYGLGRKHVVLAPGAVYIWKANVTDFDVWLTKGPTGATYELKSFTAVGVNEVTQNGDTNNATLDHGKASQTGLDGSVSRFIQITNTHATRSLYVEGIDIDRDDHTTGVHMYEAAHAGYGIDNYVTSELWADSLPLIPNLGLVVLPIGSNDFYAGGTAAAAKAKIESRIALIRTKTGKNPPIVLIGYYDRPAPAKVEDWSVWTQMYKDIAAADDKVTFLDMVPVFGPKVSDVDNRDGLNYAADHVHFTDAGAELFANAVADFILPKGAGERGATGLVAPSVQAAIDASPQLPIVNIGAFAGGAASFASLSAGKAYLTTSLTGNITLAPSGMPTPPAGREAHMVWFVNQDATGGRTITHDVAFKQAGVVQLDPAPNAKTRLSYYYDGSAWHVTSSYISKALVGLPLVDNVADANKVISGPQQAGLGGDQNAVYTANWAGGAMALSAFGIGTYGGYRMTLTSATASSFAASGKPTIAAGRECEFFLEVVQDATGGRVFSLGAGILKPAGLTVTPSTTAGAIDLYKFKWTGTELILTEFLKGIA